VAEVAEGVGHGDQAGRDDDALGVLNRGEAALVFNIIGAIYSPLAIRIVFIAFDEVA